MKLFSYRNVLRITSLLIIFGIGVFLTSCATTSKDFRRAQQQDTIIGYKTFLAEHPNSKQAVLARTRIDEIKKRQEKETRERQEAKILLQQKEKVLLSELKTYKIGVFTLDEFRKKWDFSGTNKLGIVNVAGKKEYIIYVVGRVLVDPPIIRGALPPGTAMISGLEWVEHGALKGNPATNTSNVPIKKIAILQFNLENKILMNIQHYEE